MIQKLLVALDKVAAQALKASVQPISAGTDIAYEAGRRIGYAAGIAAARQQVIDFHADAGRDDDKL